MKSWRDFSLSHNAMLTGSIFSRRMKKRRREEIQARVQNANSILYGGGWKYLVLFAVGAIPSDYWSHYEIYVQSLRKPRCENEIKERTNWIVSGSAAELSRQQHSLSNRNGRQITVEFQCFPASNSEGIVRRGPSADEICLEGICNIR